MMCLIFELLNDFIKRSNSKKIHLATFRDQLPYSKHLIDHVLILTGRTLFAMKKKVHFVITFEVVMFCL